MDPTDPFRPILEKVLSYTPDPFLKQREDFPEPEPPSSGLLFYDRHIDLQLSCKKLGDFRSIGPVLSRICDEAIAEFLGGGFRFPVRGFLGMLRPSPAFVSDAKSVYTLYKNRIGGVSPQFPSKFYFHPELSIWRPVFVVVAEPQGDSKTFELKSSLEVSWKSIRTPENEDELALSLVANGNHNKVRGIADKYRHIATWHFYPMTSAGKYILKEMKTTGAFRWETSGTVGLSTISSTLPPSDAEHGVLHKARIITARAKTGKRTHKPLTTLKEDHPEPRKAQKKPAYVTISRTHAKSVRRRLDPRQYMQHAWATAVERDSTFVVFNCGIYERIGVRHRESRTFYLSPMFEPINCQNPSYGQLHTGLHIAIIRDVLDRYEQAMQKNGKKRPADHLDGPEERTDAKRRKHSASELNKDQLEQIARQLSERELGLVTLNFGIYLSPAPAAFLRLESSCAPGLHKAFKPTKKCKFSQYEYFQLTLGKSIASGAVGVIHPARVTATLKSGETLEHQLAIKLAFSKKQQQKLRAEYQIYTHLALARVEETVTVHGLFEDADSGALALLMEYGGVSLRDLKIEEPTRYNKALRDDRQSFLQALGSVHKAGVRHGDIRPDNILVNNAGKISIIDFDCSTLDAFSISEQMVTDEVQRLEAILNGTYVDG